VSEPEILVVLETACDGLPPPDAGAALRAFGPLTGRLRPRLALLDAPPERAADVARLSGVAGAFTADPPPALRDTFTAAEALFVDAWLARHADEPPPPGDGLPWDSPGRLPPDLPPTSRPPLGRPARPEGA
jgi:hypothetical protein